MICKVTKSPATVKADGRLFEPEARLEGAGTTAAAEHETEEAKHEEQCAGRLRNDDQDAEVIEEARVKSQSREGTCKAISNKVTSGTEIA